MLARRLRPVGPTRAWARSLAAAAGKPPGKPNLPPLPFPMRGSRQQQGSPKPMELTGRVVIATDKTFTSLKLCSGCGVELAPKSEAAVAGQAFAEEDARGISLASRRKRGAYATYDESSGLLCSRCRALREGNVWEAYDAIADIDPAVFKKQLKALVARRQWSLCLKVVSQSVSRGPHRARPGLTRSLLSWPRGRVRPQVVDAADFEGSIVTTLRSAVGKTPIILAINKAECAMPPVPVVVVPSTWR